MVKAESSKSKQEAYLGVGGGRTGALGETCQERGRSLVSGSSLQACQPAEALKDRQQEAGWSSELGDSRKGGNSGRGTGGRG